MVRLVTVTYYNIDGVVQPWREDRSFDNIRELALALAFIRQDAEIFNNHSDVNLCLNGLWYYGAI